VIHASWVSFVVCDTIVRVTGNGDSTVGATKTSLVLYSYWRGGINRIPQLCHGGGWIRVHFAEFGERPPKLDSSVLTTEKEKEREREREREKGERDRGRKKRKRSDETPSGC